MVHDAELDALVRAFQRRTATKAQWTHHAHLAAGTWYVYHYGPDKALDELRSGIRALNEALGGANTADAGYHETITRAFVVLIAQIVGARGPNATAAECAREVIDSPLGRPDALARYYSKERLMSAGARAAWVEPDLRPLIREPAPE